MGIDRQFTVGPDFLGCIGQVPGLLEVGAVEADVREALAREDVLRVLRRELLVFRDCLVRLPRSGVEVGEQDAIPDVGGVAFVHLEVDTLGIVRALRAPEEVAESRCCIERLRVGFDGLPAGCFSRLGLARRILRTAQVEAGGEESRLFLEARHR